MLQYFFMTLWDSDNFLDKIKISAWWKQNNKGGFDNG